MPPAKKSGSATPRKRAASNGAPALTPVPKSTDEVAANLSILRDRLISSVTLTTERLQDTVDDAVRRGRMTSKDAEELLAALVSAGRAQTEALLSDLEQLLGRGPAMRVRTADHAEAVRRTVDAARRRVGGGTLPIEGYDDLTAAEIVKRVKDLTPAELRKVRDYEAKHGARKSVLNAVEKKLG